MLDLDHLAQERAKKVNEREESWKDAVWSAEFQKLSANMSDGEVESLLASSPTVRHFVSLVGYLTRESGSRGQPPFTVLQNEADRAGVSLGDWIRSKFGGS